MLKNKSAEKIRIAVDVLRYAARKFLPMPAQCIGSRRFQDIKFRSFFVGFIVSVIVPSLYSRSLKGLNCCCTHSLVVTAPMSDSRHVLLLGMLRTEFSCAPVALKALVPMVRIIHVLITRLASAKSARTAIALKHPRAG
jgi:hypothetical protein